MKTLKLILVILLIGFNSKIEAQYVTIPDAAFVSYLQSNFPSCMNGNQLDTICISNVNFVIVDVDALGISDLTGIQYFDYLELLNCQSNTLSTLPNLPNTLLALFCSGNQLTSLPNLPSGLQNLYCLNNQLTSLPNLPATLGLLDCRNNFLVNLPSLPISLYELSCSENQLSNIPTLPPNLMFFDCSYNNISSLPTLNDGLLTLGCAYNPITNLPILPFSLTELWFSKTLVSDFPNIHSNITNVVCDSSLITCFPTIPETITNLSILGNPFTCLPNYITNMDATTLAFPLCVENDFVNNPNGCNPFKGIHGSIYAENPSNCNLDISDNILINFPIKLYDASNNLIAQTTSNNIGNYQFSNDNNNYLVKIDTLNRPFIVSCQFPGIDSLVTVGPNAVVNNVNFPVKCRPGFDIGVQSALRSGWVFPGLNHSLKITAGDLGQFYQLNCPTNVSGQIQISLAGPVSFQSNMNGTLIPTVAGNVLTYDIPNFGAINMFNDFGLILNTNTTAQIGDQICITITVTPEIGDNNINNNIYSYCYNVVNSYDPNMKEVYPVNVEPGFEDYFTYTIHFQNTGSAPAMNIRLLDTLDANLDLETFEITNYSHYQTANVRGNILTFHFPNIQLPDSTSNPEGSKGYVQYRIKPKANLALGTQIKNTANIYFDYNDPIVTNTTVNEYVTTSGIKEIEELSVRVYPNPFSSSTTVAFGQSITNADIRLYNVYGQEVRKISNFSGTKLQIAKENLNAGIYFLQVMDEHKTQKIKLIISE